MPGVLLIVTGYDLENYGNLPCGMQIKSKDGSPLKKPNRPSLVTDKVRFVGDPVACVIAQTPDAAKDAAELVSIDIDILPATTLATEAAMPGAPVLYDDVAGNIALDFQFGEPDTVDKAFKAAHHISRVDIRNNRIVVAPMEPRSAIAHYNSETDCSTMRLGCQGLSLIHI